MFALWKLYEEYVNSVALEHSIEIYSLKTPTIAYNYRVFRQASEVSI